MSVTQVAIVGIEISEHATNISDFGKCILAD